MHRKITKRVVDKTQPDPIADVFLWDGELRGFGLRVKPSGVKSFIIQYRNTRGTSRRFTIGQYGRLTAEDARSEAKKLLGDVERGHDPAVARRTARKVMTIKELCDTYYEDSVQGKVLSRGKPKKASTLAVDKGRLSRHIIPLLGNTVAEDLDRADIENFMHDVAAGKTAKDVRTGKRGRARVSGGLGTASKAVSLLSAIFNYGIRKGWLERNPCQGIEKPADNKKERFLAPNEYRRLGEAIDRCTELDGNPVALSAIVALMLTGCRKNEILKLRQAEIDVAGDCLRLGDTKTGAQLRPCGKTALKFISELQWGNDIHVFPANRGIGPLVDIKRTLQKVITMAEVEKVTSHVFRHSYATVAHELNYSELTIAGLLGHTSGSVTGRYAHHVDHALAAAADHVSSLILERLKGLNLMKKGNS